MKKYKLKSYCKINLSLRVLKRQENGYHKIMSLMTFCDLYDVVSITKNNKTKDEVSFSGKFKRGIKKNSNTIIKTLNLLRHRKLLKKKHFKINVQKNIPHGSGLGGGSSNAAILLNSLKSLMNLKVKKQEIYEIASRVGSDVPIALERKSTFLDGKKNKILRINTKFKFIAVIVYPNISCSTREIYKRNKNFTSLKYRFKHTSVKKKLVNILKKENNDLEKKVIEFHPKIGKLINFIKVQKGCYFSRITGSGSACIGIFSNMKRALYTKKLIKLKFPKYWTVLSKTI